MSHSSCIRRISGIFSACHFSFRKSFFALCLISVFIQTDLKSQTYSSPASVKGTVTSAGVQNSSLNGIETATPRRGWFKFDITTIPAGSSITSAVLNYPTSAGTINSGTLVNQLNGLSFDPQAIVSGIDLYTSIVNGAAGVGNLFTGSWAGSHPLALNTNGPAGGNAGTTSNLLNYIQTRVNGGGTFLAFSLVRGSTNNYNFSTPSVTINYTLPPPCIDPPGAGNAVCQPNPACPSVIRTFSLSGGTFGFGQTFQWQSSPDNIVWSNISGAASSQYLSSVSVQTYFRCEVTCGAGTDLSASVLALVDNFLTCYCTPLYGNGCGSGDAITNVSIPSTVLNNSTGCTASPHFSFYNSQVADIVKGNAYSLSVSFGVDPNQFCAVWVDIDQSGSFESSELIAMSSSNAGSNGTVSFNFSLPQQAVSGQTRLRVRGGDDVAIAAAQSCGATNSTFGETEDYLINIVSPSSCVDPPIAGSISGPSTLCSGATGTLVASGYTQGTQLQWQSSPTAGGPFADIAGETSPILNISGGTATYYHLSVTCITTVFTSEFFVDLGSSVNCLCPSIHQNGCTFNDEISNVSIDVLNNSSGCSPGAYTFYNSGLPVPNLAKTVSYSLSVSFGSDPNQFFGAWIDYNQNGQFESSEFLGGNSINAGSGGTALINVNISGAALTGLTALRVNGGNDFPVNSNQGCGFSFSSWGETEDYLVTIDAAPPCTDPPVAGSISGDLSVCPGNSAVLNLNGFSAGTIVQWQQSPDGILWTDVAGANSSLYITSALNSATYFRAFVTCVNSDTAQAVLVSINSYLDCYCKNNLHTSSCGNGHITFAGIDQTTLSNLSGCSFVPGSGPYSAFPASGSTTANLLQSVVYNVTVQTDNNQGPTSISLWIDYDHSGTFDSLEWNEIATFNNNATAAITIPLNALTGQTGMRIRSRFSGNPNGANDACSSFGSGETEDYIITIDPAPVCIDPPVAGNISGNFNICSGDSAILSLVGYTLGTTLQWQESADGIIWSDIAGASNPNYTTASLAATVYYRVVVTCITSSDTTAPAQILINPFYQCYCKANLNPVACGNGHIVNVTVASTSLINPSGCVFIAGTGAYSSYPPSGSTTASLQQSVAYSLNVETDNSGGPTIVSVWIDYNQDGIYDASEWNQVYTADNNNFVSITIPNNALTGLTGLRIRSRFSGSNNFATDACTSFNSGETEDYIVTISAAPPCTNPPVSGTISGNFGVCSGNSTVLTLNSATPGSLLQWQFSSNGTTWTDILSNGNNTSYTVLGIISPTYYRVKVTCQSDVFTQPVLVSIVPCINMANGSDTTCAGNFYDSGGSLANYLNNEQFIYTIYPDSGNQLQVTFTSFAIENGFDFLKIYDGNSLAAPQIGPASGFTGAVNPGTITSTAVDGSITFEFTSNSTNNFTGWTATLQCVSSSCSGVPDAGTVIQPSFNCLNESTSLIASGITGSSGILYQWEESDDNGAADPWISISGASSSSYTTPILTSAIWYRVFALCVTSGLADTSSAYQIQFKPSPDPVASSNSPICEGNDIILSSSNNASGQSTGNSFSWMGPSGFSSTQQSPVISNSLPVNAGAYTVVITNQFLCSAAATTNAVVVNPNPVLFVALQTDVTCNGGSDGSVDLDASSGNPPFVFSDGSSFNLNGVFSGLLAGVYFFTVSDSNSCPGDLTVTINEPPPTTVANAGSDQSICNDSTGLAANTALVGSGAWSLVSGSAVISNLSDPATSVINLGSGNNIFRWTIVNAACNDSTFDEVIINAGNSPIATLTGSENICLGNLTPLTISFTGASPWTYSYTDGTTIYGPVTTSANPMVINVSPSASVSYSLINVFGGSCPGTVQGVANIIVSTAPPAGQTQALIGLSNYACVGTVANLTCQPVVNAVEYIWDAPAGSYFDGNPANVSPYITQSPSAQITFGSPNGSGYLVCVKPSNGCGTAVQRCQWVRGITSVPAGIAGPLIACENTTQAYSTGAITGATGYAWSSSGGITIVSGNGTQNVIVSFPAGFTTGTLCVSATTPCYTSPPKCITISNTAASLTQIMGPNKVCPGSNPINYVVAAPAGISTFNWQLPPNASGSSTSNSINVTYNAGFTAGVLCVTGYSICNVPTAQKCYTINTGVPPTPTSISGPDNTVCSQSVVYTCPSVQGASSYNWTVPAAASIVSGNGTNAINVQYGSAVPLTGQVCVVSQSTCIGTGPPRCITIKGAPNVPGPISTSQTVICPGQDAVDFSIPPLTGNVSFNWLVPSGSVILTGQGTNSILADMGTTPGNVIAIAFNACGNASATYFVSLTCPRISGYNFEAQEINNLSNARVFPNPSDGIFNLLVNKTEKSTCSIQVADMYGRIVYTDNPVANKGYSEMKLDLTLLSKGVYILTVETGMNKSTMRIAIE